LEKSDTYVNYLKLLKNFEKDAFKKFSFFILQRILARKQLQFHEKLLYSYNCF